MAFDETETVTKVIASGVQITVGLADDRQMTFTTGFEGDEPDSAVNARFDRIMALADRLKAKYEIRKLQEDVRKAKDTLSQLAEDRERVRENYAKQRATQEIELQERVDSKDKHKQAYRDHLNRDVLTLQETRQSEWQAGADEHIRSKRQGAYEPRGARLRNLALIDDQIERAKGMIDSEMISWEVQYDAAIAVARETIAKGEAEAAEAERSMDVSVKRHNDFLAAAEERLAECQALIDGTG